ncbi:hypothetical protein BDY24DRAFT_377937 [Mrakia frigida]|uniref:uncharacterized protein n=1 Tax=Mrakia frigida TaxID=29902 RepID=UPI003FCC094C
MLWIRIRYVSDRCRFDSRSLTSLLLSLFLSLQTSSPRTLQGSFLRRRPTLGGERGRIVTGNPTGGSSPGSRGGPL